MSSTFEAGENPSPELVELRRRSLQAIAALGADFQGLFQSAQLGATKRAEKYRINSLLDEFQQSLCTGIDGLKYELAFLSSWYDEQPLYQPRHWINDYTAGVYFIYDRNENLRYVGSSCGGALGNRIYRKWHHPHREFVDVVLFEKSWCHFALAFEVLAISRLKPPQNGNTKKLTIPPPPAFAHAWPEFVTH